MPGAGVSGSTGTIDARKQKPMTQYARSGSRVLPLAVVLFFLALLQVIPSVRPPVILGQSMVSRVVSKHVRMRIPAEREWLARETIAELERGYVFIHRVTGKRLPRLIQVTVSWAEGNSRISLEDASITIGMNTPAASAGGRAYLLHALIREMARMALLGLSERGAARDENRFLLEGMAEILTHEYDRSSRSLGAAWAHCHLMDRIHPLGLAAMASWAGFSEDRQDLRSASPGITFLMTCRELHSRERLLKLFEGLRGKALPEGIAYAFRTPAPSLESAWLDRVRRYAVPDSLTVGSDEDAPRLEEIATEPGVILPGRRLTVRALILDRNRDLLPESIYIEDVPSGRIARGRAAADARQILLEFPVEGERGSGSYGYRLTAIDEAGNLRSWAGTYHVGDNPAQD